MSDNLQVNRWLANQLPPTNQRRLAVVTGARQTGKTTLVKQVYPNLMYFNLDDAELRSTLSQIKTVSWAKDIGPAILDEVQKLPSVFEKIKYAYDDNKIQFSVLLGSAQILLLHKIRESLAGRVFIFELWPLMLTELQTLSTATFCKPPLLESIISADSMATLLNSQPSVLMPEPEQRLLDAENHLLIWGGMPELLHLPSSADKSMWLKSYVHTYLERDLMDLAQLKHLEPFRQFQKLAALRVSKLLNYAELAKDADISVDTARRYLEYLKLSYQVLFLQPYSGNLTSRVVKTPKIYWSDIGLLRELSGITGTITGEIFENYVVMEIFKWIQSNQSPCELYFYRTRSGLELDLLLKTPKGFIGVEIKSSQRIRSADYRPMQRVAESLKSEWLGGLCIYRGNKIECLAEPNIWAIPSSRLLSSH